MNNFSVTDFNRITVLEVQNFGSVKGVANTMHILVYNVLMFLGDHSNFPSIVLVHALVQ